MRERTEEALADLGSLCCWWISREKDHSDAKCGEALIVEEIFRVFDACCVCKQWRKEEGVLILYKLKIFNSNRWKIEGWDRITWLLIWGDNWVERLCHTGPVPWICMASTDETNRHHNYCTLFMAAHASWGDSCKYWGLRC